jgi:hypothetical protein
MEKNKTRQQAIQQVEVEEIKLLFAGLHALQSIWKADISSVQPLNCHMFTVEKFLADGTHENFKLCMVANGNEQDPDLYPDCSSPTVAVHSILTCLSVAV